MTTFRSLIAVSSLAFVSLATAACGEESKEDDASSTGGGAGEGNGGSDGGDTGGSTSTGGSDGSGGSDSCVRDSGEPSGSSTVQWSDGEIAEGLTFTLGETDIEPSELTVPVDERFGIENPVGGGVRVIKIGCAEGQTMPASITSGFIIHEPGTYEIIDVEANDFAGLTLGTVTVE